MKILVSSKRLTWLPDGSWVNFNQKRTRFFQGTAPIVTMTHQVINGGIECSEIFPDAARREENAKAWVSESPNDRYYYKIQIEDEP